MNFETSMMTEREAVLVIGRGESTIAAIRDAVQATSGAAFVSEAAWKVAAERKIVVAHDVHEGDAGPVWCVIVPEVNREELLRDEAILASETVPGHSFALARWRSVARAEKDAAGYVADRSPTGEARSLFVTRDAEGWGSAGDPDRGQRLGSRLALPAGAGPVFATASDARAEAKRRWARTR